MVRRNFMKTLSAVAVTAAFGLSSVNALAAETIKVGVLHSLSGTMAISETALKETVLMAIAEINSQGRRARQEAGAGGRRSGVELAAVRREGAAVAEQGQGGGDFRLLDFGVAQVGAAGLQGTQRPAVLPGAVRRRGTRVQRLLHRCGAKPAGDSGGRVSDEQGWRFEAKRFVLLGTDYVYPRTTNKILRAFLKSKGVADADIMEEYTPFGHSDYQTIIAKIKKFSSEGKKTAVVSTINGDSNVPFYKELGNAGMKATEVPVVAFSVGEEELRGVDTKPLVGHLASWNYFMSLKNVENEKFTKLYRAWAVKQKLPNADKAVTNDPMEATYIGVYMWKQAVEKAKSTDVDKVIAAMAGQTFKAPSGFTIKMDEKNHHLHKPVFIGEIKADGQFNVVWKTPGPVKAQPWSPYIPGNDKKKDEPEGK
jgi:urea transport system substrate-binding protein